MTTSWWDSAQQLSRASDAVQWLLVASALLTAVLTVTKLVVGNRLDELKAEKARIQAAQLQTTQDELQNAQKKLSAIEASQQPRKLTDAQAMTLAADLPNLGARKLTLAHTPKTMKALLSRCSFKKCSPMLGGNRKA
jgi:hypothetical protein